jgi:hypothetical protein
LTRKFPSDGDGVESPLSTCCPGEDAERRYVLLPPISWPEFSGLTREGICAPALIRPHLPARASVVFDRRQPLFDFAEDAGGEGAASAFVFLALDEEGEPADLVAWAPQARRLAAWFGASPLLGAENLWSPRLTKEQALAVFESPLGWLRAGREGVVVIDPRRSAPLLRLAEPLVAESIDHGQRLRRRLTVRPPRVYVAKSELRVAA